MGGCLWWGQSKQFHQEEKENSHWQLHKCLIAAEGGWGGGQVVIRSRAAIHMVKSSCENCWFGSSPHLSHLLIGVKHLSVTNMQEDEILFKEKSQTNLNQMELFWMERSSPSSLHMWRFVYLKLPLVWIKAHYSLCTFDQPATQKVYIHFLS